MSGFGAQHPRITQTFFVLYCGCSEYCDVISAIERGSELITNGCTGPQQSSRRQIAEIALPSSQFNLALTHLDTHTHTLLQFLTVP
jgi:hypothetical protein